MNSNETKAWRNYALFWMFFGTICAMVVAFFTTTVIIADGWFWVLLGPTILFVTLALYCFDNAWPWIENQLDEMFD